MIKIRLNILSVDGMIAGFLGLTVVIFLGLSWIIPAEEFYRLSLENPMWALHISAGSAFIITLILAVVVSRLKRRNKGE